MDESSASYEIATRAGRLIEARIFRLTTREDADAYSAAIAGEVARHTGGTPVLLADHRPVVIYPQPATDRLVELFQEMNQRMERIAILVAPTNATLYLQLQRLVREAGFEARQVFREARPALEHLRASLGVSEMHRAELFLAEHREPV